MTDRHTIFERDRLHKRVRIATSKTCDHAGADLIARTVEEVGGNLYTLVHYRCERCGRSFARYDHRATKMKEDSDVEEKVPDEKA